MVTINEAEKLAQIKKPQIVNTLDEAKKLNLKNPKRYVFEIETDMFKYFSKDNRKPYYRKLLVLKDKEFKEGTNIYGQSIYYSAKLYEEEIEDRV
jgi:hypothetical protein